ERTPGSVRFASWVRPRTFVCPRRFLPVSGFASGLLCSCAGRIFLPFAGAVVWVSFVCVCCGSSVVWPDAINGNANAAITVVIRILIIFPFTFVLRMWKIFGPAGSLLSWFFLLRFFPCAFCISDPQSGHLSDGLFVCLLSEESPCVNSELFMGGGSISLRSTAKPWTFHNERMQLNHALFDNNRQRLQLRTTNRICVEV